MAVTKKQAAKPAKSTAVIPWDEELAKAAEEQGDARKSGGGGSFIGTRGGVFAFDGKDIGQEMSVVVLDYVMENQYYDKPFDQDNPAPPVCYAFSRVEADLAPHPEAPDPQHDKCAGCVQNAYKSAANGKGKACKNVMRLAMITVEDLESAETVEAAEVAMLKVSVTNVKHFNTFLDQLKNAAYGKKRPTWGVICDMTIAPSRETQIVMGFKRGDDIDDSAILQALKAKVDMQKDKTISAYSQPDAEAAPAAPAKASKFAKKK